jgi:hypothetical protein
MRLRGLERVLFVLGATVYIVGVFGAAQFMNIPVNTTFVLLGVGGGMLLIVNLAILF